MSQGAARHRGTCEATYADINDVVKIKQHTPFLDLHCPQMIATVPADMDSRLAEYSLDRVYLVRSVLVTAVSYYSPAPRRKALISLS